MIKRELEEKIRSKIGKKKIIVLFGARQVGKTTLIHSIFDKEKNVIWYNGDEDMTKDLFEKADLNELANIIRGNKTIVIDEAQRIKDIGIKLKILQDNFGDEIQIVATGSSSFDLANKINEPLTGRKWTFKLSSFTISELVSNFGYDKEKNNLEKRLIYGSYPDVVLASDIEDKEAIIKELSSDDLYKDVLNLGEIIKTDKLRKILQALAFQVGNQVSMNELGSLVGLDSKTIDKYVSLLEQSFIIFRLPSFSRNLRNELKSSQKIFFYDCGIRNALINDFRPIELRPDKGSLFENYIISELKKRFPDDNIYFWRNKNKQEIDYLIEKNGEITAIEVKWSENKKVSFPNEFVKEYNPAKSIVINSKNFLDIFRNELTSI